MHAHRRKRHARAVGQRRRQRRTLRHARRRHAALDGHVDRERVRATARRRFCPFGARALRHRQRHRDRRRQEQGRAGPSHVDALVTAADGSQAAVEDGAAHLLRSPRRSCRRRGRPRLTASKHPRPPFTRRIADQRRHLRRRLRSRTPSTPSTVALTDEALSSARVARRRAAQAEPARGAWLVTAPAAPCVRQTSVEPLDVDSCDCSRDVSVGRREREEGTMRRGETSTPFSSQHTVFSPAGDHSGPGTRGCCSGRWASVAHCST